METTEHKTKSNQMNFRLWPENKSAVTHARKIGFNVSELLNEIVSKHLRTHMVRKAHARVRAWRAFKPEKLTPKINPKSRH